MTRPTFSVRHFFRLKVAAMNSVNVKSCPNQSLDCERRRADLPSPILIALLARRLFVTNAPAHRTSAGYSMFVACVLYLVKQTQLVVKAACY